MPSVNNSYGVSPDVRNTDEMPGFMQHYEMPFWISQRFLEFVYTFPPSCKFIEFAIFIRLNLYVENVISVSFVYL